MVRDRHDIIQNDMRPIGAKKSIGRGEPAPSAMGTYNMDPSLNIFSETLFTDRSLQDE
jgi:hypothetical protein